jgi:hypothetical protein
MSGCPLFAVLRATLKTLSPAQLRIRVYRPPLSVNPLPALLMLQFRHLKLTVAVQKIQRFLRRQATPSDTQHNHHFEFWDMGLPLFGSGHLACQSNDQQDSEREE